MKGIFSKQLEEAFIRLSGGFAVVWGFFYRWLHGSGRTVQCWMISRQMEAALYLPHRWYPAKREGTASFPLNLLVKPLLTHLWCFLFSEEIFLNWRRRNPPSLILVFQWRRKWKTFLKPLEVTYNKQKLTMKYFLQHARVHGPGLLLFHCWLCSLKTQRIGQKCKIFLRPVRPIQY